MTIILNKTITPSIVYTFAVRAESTALSSDNTNYCTVQYPIGNINNTLQVVVSSVTSPIIDLTATVSQCQGVNFTYLVLFNGSTTIPNWIIVNNTIPMKECYDWSKSVHHDNRYFKLFSKLFILKSN